VADSEDAEPLGIVYESLMNKLFSSRAKATLLQLAVFTKMPAMTARGASPRFFCGRFSFRHQLQ